MFRTYFAASVFFALAICIANADPDREAKDDTGTRSVKVHRFYVWSISATKDEKQLLTGSGGKEGVVRSWKFPEMEETKKVEFGNGLMHCLITADGRWIVSTCEKQNKRYPGLTIWDARTWQPVHRFPNNFSKLTALSPNNQLVADIDFENRITVRTLESGKVICRTEPFYIISRELCFSADSRYIYLVYHPDKLLTCLDAMTGKKRWGSDVAIGGAYTLQASRDGRFVAEGGGDVIETVTGRLYRSFRRPLSPNFREDSLYYSVFDPESRSLVCAADHDGLFRWDLHTSKLVESHPELGYSVQGIRMLSQSWTLVSRKKGELVFRKFSPLPKAVPTKARLTDEEWLDLWRNLKGTDAAKAIESMDELSLHPAMTPPLLKKHIRLLPDETLKQIDRLVRDLEDDRFSVRKQAAAELAKLGNVAYPALKSAYLQKDATDDLRRSINELFRKLENRFPEEDQVQGIRGVQVLGMIGAANARAVLKELSQHSAADPIVEEARAALQRLEENKP